MKHSALLALLYILILLFLCSCSLTSPVPTEPPVPTEALPAATEAPTVPPTEEPAQAPTEAPTEAPTLPPHSDLYIPGVSVEDVILYFNEVCLDAEYIHAGNPSLLQKWISPITYYLHGEPTPEDLETLNDFVRWLNTIEGFPGIYQTQEPAGSNLDIHFCDQQEMLSLMGDGFGSMDGAVTFWYMDDVIYDAIICYRTDLTQYLRNSVILEEIYNGLGPIQDTALRPDSIIYSEFSEPQELTAIDELILRLLYHPDLECGMDADACEEIIRQLYY